MEQFLADFLLLFLLCRRNVLAKAFSRAFSHTRTTAKTRNAFSLLSALFEQFAHIASGFATIPPCPSALSRTIRACAFIYAAARPPVSERLHLLCENAPTFLSPKFKSAIIHYILSKRRPYVVFGGTAFWRTAFCRRKEKRAFHYAYFTTASGIDPCAPSQTAEFAAISGFAARIISFPVYNCVSKNTRRFRALSAFEKSSLTSAHIRRPFLAAFTAFDPRLQSSSATLRARVCPA